MSVLVTGLRNALRVGWREGGATPIALIALGALLDGAGTVMALPLLRLLMESRRSFAALGGALAVVAIILVARSLVFRLRDDRLARLQSTVLAKLRSRLVWALSGASWERLSRLDHASVANVIGVESQRLTTTGEVLGKAASAVAALVVQLILAFLLSPIFATVAAVMTAAAMAVVIASQRMTLGAGRRYVAGNRALLASTSGLLGTLKAAIAQGVQADFAAEFDKTQLDLALSHRTFLAKAARRRAVMGAAGAAAAATLLLLGYGPLALSIPVLLTLFLILVRLSGPLTLIYGAVQNVSFVLPSLEAVRALERGIGHAEIIPAADEATFGPIVLDAVRYRHPGGGGFTNASLTIEPGEFVGVCGESGAGKTTLLDLVTGLLTPQAGSIAIGDRALKGAALAAWRSKLAYVPQDSFLFSDTLRRNLLWGNPQADDPALLHALEAVGLGELLVRLGGLEQPIGERGALLSGGERQRVALARALLRRPAFLVLDEATSALDGATEARIFDHLRGLDPRPTILIVSHREATLAFCDRLVRLTAGSVDSRAAQTRVA